MASARHPRRGFTLVEMLVVILVISVLVGLLAPAVLQAYRKGDDAKIVVEMKQLENAIAAFKQHFGVSYIPDRLTFPPDAPTRDYFKRIWPRLNQARYVAADSQEAIAIVNYWLSNRADPILIMGVPTQRPDGNYNVSSATIYGDQVMAFFLGGKRIDDPATITPDDARNYVGFSTNPTEPMFTGGSRVGPFFDFPPNRLNNFRAAQVNIAFPVRFARYPSFIDPYGSMPYMYMSSGAAGNDYNNVHNNGNNLQFIQNKGEVDVNGNPVTIQLAPYRLNSGKFASANSFQIICAGRDEAFGRGGVNWAGYPGGAANKYGQDDTSNFWSVPLGAAQ